MSWPVDDIDLTPPTYTRPKILASVEKFQQILAADLIEHLYYMVIELDHAATPTWYVWTRTAGQWQAVKVSDTEVKIFHNLSLTDVDKFEIQVQCSGVAIAGATDDGRGLHAHVISKNSTEFRLKIREGHRDYAEDGTNGFIHILCVDHAKASAYPVDDLSTSHLDSGSDSPLAARPQIHAALKKWQDYVLTGWPYGGPYPKSHFYGVVVAHTANYDNPGILNNNAAAEGWTYTALSDRMFRITHNLNLTYPHAFSIQVQAGIGSKNAPANSGSIPAAPWQWPQHAYFANVTKDSFEVCCTANSPDQNVAASAGLYYIWCVQYADGNWLWKHFTTPP